MNDNPEDLVETNTWRVPALRDIERDIYISKQGGTTGINSNLSSLTTVSVAGDFLMWKETGEKRSDAIVEPLILLPCLYIFNF
ncbi:hypothetical protein ACH33_04405 [Aneurinibacillus sp. XH2]|nr:hypothetical protein ACH33_04405 [Aneurinibacillus sp. XH2]